MQDGGRDSKPGVGPRNITATRTENGQAVPAWYAAKQCPGCGHMGGWHGIDCSTVDITGLEAD